VGAGVPGRLPGPAGGLRTLVVQSVPPGAPAWVHRCVASVEGLGLDHEVLDDAFLDLAPGWLPRDDVLPVTDVARLVLLRDRLASWDRVVWLDADVLVWGPLALPDDPLAVCAEQWVTGGPGGSLRAVPFTCNAALSATSAAAVEVLLEDALAAAARGPLGRRALGPDLLTARQRTDPLPTIPGVGVLSPLVVSGDPEAWAVQLAAEPVPLVAANLCGSMADDDGVLDACVDRLLS
jgi:hypothetical protein